MAAQSIETRRMFLRTVKEKREEGPVAPPPGALLRLLTGDSTRRAHAEAVGAWDWGPLLVARHLWRELGLEATLDARGRDRGAAGDRALALVASRLDTPTSEHGMARWLETAYVCDRSGRRWRPAWRADAERRASTRPRVRVQDRQLRQWYSTLDRLVEAK